MREGGHQGDRRRDRVLTGEDVLARPGFQLFGDDMAQVTNGVGNVSPIFLDDMQIGDRYTSAEHALDEAQIIAFATQFDPQPFHLDHEAAKSSMFGGLAASGWHTVAITMRLMVTSGLPVAGGIVGAGADVQWPRPTRPDDVLHVVSEIISIVPSKSRPDRGMVTTLNTTYNERGEEVQVLTAKMVVPRRPA